MCVGGGQTEPGRAPRKSCAVCLLNRCARGPAAGRSLYALRDRTRGGRWRKMEARDPRARWTDRLVSVEGCFVTSKNLETSLRSLENRFVETLRFLFAHRLRSSFQSFILVHPGVGHLRLPVETGSQGRFVYNLVPSTFFYI